MASKTEICNIALSHIGVGKEIANIDTEKSEEASACRRLYDLMRDATLKDFNWPFASKVADLSLIEQFDEDDRQEWKYSYRYPSDCLEVRKILGTSRIAPNQNKLPIKILKDDAARIIYSDQESAKLEYTARVVDPSFYPPDFILALSLRIAAYVAPRLAKGDPFGLRKQALDLYNIELSRAKAASANEEQRDELPYSEFERGR